jgi:predicted pyridoxine 5'-phosphate oxidase superfamily flavin-nucleotide-binding protein
MTSPFHAGELAVQERAGTRQMAGRIGKGIGATVSAAARRFIATQRMAVIGSIDPNGRVWASLLAGRQGFLQAIDDQTIRIDVAPAPGDPLLDNLRARGDAGMVVIEPATRRRVRLNGVAEVLPEGGLILRTRQVFANCPKYIQAREWGTMPAEAPIPGEPQRGKVLTTEQRARIARADTFFIATAHPNGGVDASHRGGNPGFVAVADGGTLVFPDYGGNTMFQTLGNLAVNPRAGLLFVDFDSGDTLQLTGRASVSWDAERVAAVAGAERLVEFVIDEVIAVPGASPLRGRLVGYSPFNPS